jgi:FkbM family methyltransferase
VPAVTVLPRMPLATTPDGRRISYAQNGEDIVLLRALGEQREGRWIDVGANHPVNDSVTKNFSDLGWCGMNVEPVTSFHNALVAARPRDINVLAAVSETTGTMTFTRNESNLDLSTFDQALAAVYRARGDRLVDVDVPVVRLDELCRRHLAPGPVDFVKVDTEGHDLAVLASHDFEAYPPRVLLAEATEARLGGIVELVEGAGMRFLTFDGLNSWFVADDEASALGPAISRPPSPVLDWYHPAYYVNALADRDREIERLRAEHGVVDRVSRAGRRALRGVRRVLRRDTVSASAGGSS